MNSIFLKLIEHLGWADEAVLTSLEGSQDSAAPWLELFGHVLGAEHVWLARLEQRPAELAVWPRLSLEECRKAARANLVGYRALVERLHPAGFARLIHYRNSAGQKFDSTVEDMLLQVCLHGCYHRGQIAAAMRKGGAEPTPTDYIGFIRGVPAATRQP